MRRIRPEQVQPRIRLAHFNPVPGTGSWGPRRIIDLQLILVTAGTFAYVSSNENVEVAPGQLLLITPGVQHTFRLERHQGHKGFWFIHFELLPGASWAAGDYRADPLPPQLTDVSGDHYLEDCFRRCAEIISGYGKYRDEMLTTVGRELWLRLADHWSGCGLLHLSPRMQEMVYWLRHNLRKPVSRRDLADRFYVTPEHINAIFKKELGTSPTRFIHRERVMLANRLIQTRGLSVKQAAAEVGFCDQFYFSKVFKKIMGFPPSRA